MHHAVTVHEAALLGRRIADAAGPAALINVQAFAAIAGRRTHGIAGRRIIAGGRGTGNPRIVRRRAPSAMPFAVEIRADRLRLAIAVIVVPGGVVMMRVTASMAARWRGPYSRMMDGLCHGCGRAHHPADAGIGLAAGFGCNGDAGDAQKQPGYQSQYSHRALPCLRRGARARVSLWDVLNPRDEARERALNTWLIGARRGYGQCGLKIWLPIVRMAGDVMTTDNPIGVTDLNAQAERENRIELALLRGVVENLRSNRVVVPLFGLAIAAMFPQWVGLDHLTGWYCQMMLGLVPQVI